MVKELDPKGWTFNKVSKSRLFQRRIFWRIPIPQTRDIAAIPGSAARMVAPIILSEFRAMAVGLSVALIELGFPSISLQRAFRCDVRNERAIWLCFLFQLYSVLRGSWLIWIDFWKPIISVLCPIKFLLFRSFSKSFIHIKTSCEPRYRSYW